jgi:hypothetical protein
MEAEMKTTVLRVACLLGIFAAPSPAAGQTTPTPTDDGALRLATTMVAGQDQQQTKKTSPWLLVPLVSNGPKMGTSFGGLGAYLHYFDPESEVSMFGAIFQYSTTHSMLGGVFARTSFGADHHRLEGFVGFGYVENEYEDYLGTGKPFKTTDDLRAVAGRYLYRVKGGWFVGAQGVGANYLVSGATETDQRILDVLGLTGVNSGGLGLVLMHDSRDNQDMPVKGWYANLNNLANRTWLGADDDYSSYRLEVKGFVEHGKGHVFAVRENNQITSNAPTSAEATIDLRGYKLEQYLGRYMSSIEVEERIRFSRRWGATIFGGVAWLYGGSSAPLDNDGYYPSYGAGVHFVLKPEDHMLINLEYARGSEDNYGIYLKFGYSW